MKTQYKTSLRIIACIPIVAALAEGVMTAYQQDIPLTSTISFLSAMIMCQLFATVEMYIQFRSEK